MEVIVLWAMLCITIYYLPSFIALTRGKNFGGVFAINLLTGWTIVGWFVALVMACWQREAQIQYVMPSQAAQMPTPTFPRPSIQYGDLAE